MSEEDGSATTVASVAVKFSGGGGSATVVAPVRVVMSKEAV